MNEHLRAPRSALSSAFLGAVFCLGGCSSATSPAALPLSSEIAVPTAESGDSSLLADTEVLRIDTNMDQKADVWKYIKAITDPATGEERRVMVRREVDPNHDGRVDITVDYATDGTMLREAADMDFDGKVDQVSFFENNLVVRTERYLDFDDRPDEWRYYRKGQLVRIERDSNLDGEVDTWEYYEGGKVKRIGRDTNGDGDVDSWVQEDEK